MKKSIKVFFLLFSLAIQVIGASEQKPFSGNVEFAGEWLYMSPLIDQRFLFGKKNSDLSSVEHFAYKQEWQHGYRAEVAYNFCNDSNGIKVRWTQFPSFSLSRKITYTPPPLDTVFALPGVNEFAFTSDNGIPISVDAQATFDHHYLDVLFGQKFTCCPCFTLGLYGGIQYMRLDLKENLDIQDLVGSITTWCSHMWGVGPEVNVEFDYSLGNCLSLSGRGFASLLINEKLSKLSGIQDSLPFETKNERYWSIIPITGLRFGLNYSCPYDASRFCCLDTVNVDIEVGYETVLVNRGIERIFIASFSGQQSFNEQINFALHGPYLHIGVSF